MEQKGRVSSTKGPKASVPRGELAVGEPHPAAPDALRWIRSLPMERLCIDKEALASCAIEGNRLGEICLETLLRLQRGDPVSDRYILGLAWMLRSFEDEEAPYKMKREET